jgi:hypothetical protein
LYQRVIAAAVDKFFPAGTSRVPAVSVVLVAEMQQDMRYE